MMFPCADTFPLWDSAIKVLKPFTHEQVAAWKLYKKSVVVIDGAFESDFFAKKEHETKEQYELRYEESYVNIADIFIMSHGLDVLQSLEMVRQKAEDYMESWRDENYDWAKYSVCSDLLHGMVMSGQS